MSEEVERIREDILTIVGLCQKVGIRQILRVKGASVMPFLLTSVPLSEAGPFLYPKNKR